MTPFDHRLPPLTSLVAFEAAYRNLNFTRAAEELHASQASISRRVGELEASLGVVLFERRRHNVAPTPDADLLAVSVRSSLAELASTAEVLRQRAAGSTSLTIFSDLSLSAVLVAPIIGGFHRDHPDVTIRVLSSYEQIESTSEHFDLGPQYGRPGGSMHQVELIADEALFPVCSPEFLRRTPRPISANALAELPLLHVDYGDTDWVGWERFLDHAGTDARPTGPGLSFNSYQVCLDVAATGEGVALGWERSVQPWLDAGSLVRVPGLTMAQGGTINAYLPNRSTSHAIAEQFLAAIRHAVDATPP